VTHIILKITYTHFFMKDIISIVFSIWYIRYSRYILYTITWLVMVSVV